MLTDTDTLTVLCPRCRETTTRPVGWFKEHLTFACDHCPVTLRYERELLRLDIETAGLMPPDIAGAVSVVDEGVPPGPSQPRPARRR